MTPENDGSDLTYEALLAHEDGRMERVWLASIIVIVALGALWIDRVALFLFATVVLLIGCGSWIWNGFSLIRAGYVLRGKATLRPCWHPVAAVGLNFLILTAQARLGLWFAQWQVTGRFD